MPDAAEEVEVMPIVPKIEAMKASNRLADAAAGAASDTDCRPQPEKIVSVLAISPYEDDHIFLNSIFGHSKWQIRGVRSWREAVEYLSKNPTPVVVCERDLPDCSWKDVLSELAALPGQPLLVVTSRLADDDLWAEVLNLGGYDVLMKPFDKTEVFRVISLAWLSWKNRLDRVRKSALPPTLALAAGM
jgi:DNA-binding NtrC family response regulator